MDALNSWQLVKALKKATGLPAAASFKHVSPAGAALGLPLTDVERHIYFAPEGELSPIACAYIRARGADRLCSYGDWAALSDVCDAATARYLKYEVSDGIIAPGYTDEALEILKTKKKGNYNIVEIDPNYVPAPQEYKDVFGVTFQQGRNNFEINDALLNNMVTDNKDLPADARRDMIVALITLKYTQSNSVCYVKDGQAIGVGAGQQSRIHCTRLAGNKADNWWLRHHPKVLGLQFVDGIRRPDRDNAIDIYISDEHDDILADGVWQNTFKVKPEVLTAEEKQACLDRLTTSVSVHVASNVDLVIEAIYENLEAKQAIFQQLDKICDDRTIFASNTSSISMTSLAAATSRPEKVVGLHFFSPVPVMSLVEIVYGLRTSQETIDAVTEVGKQMGKRPILAKDKPGFIVNRMLLPMLNEAVQVLDEDIGTVEDVDEGMLRGCNHPMGPLALADMIGLDILLEVMETFYIDLGDTKYRPAHLLRKMVSAGYLGRKSGAGFYVYQEGKKVGVNPVLAHR